jgi:WD40 repeat protein
VQVWDVAARQPLELPLSGHTSAVSAVAFSPDGRILATGGSDDMVVLHDAGTGATLGPPLDAGSYVNSVAFSPDGRRVGVGTQAGDNLIFDVVTGTELASLPGGGFVSNVIFSPDGRRIATLAQDARVWDAATFAPIGSPMHPHVGPMQGAFSPDGRLLAIVGQAGIVGIWDPDDGVPLIAEPMPGSPPFGGVYSPDGKVLAVSDFQQRVTLYRTETRTPVGAPLPVPTGPSVGVPTTPLVAFSPDSRVVAISGLDSTIRRYGVSTLEPLGDPIAVDAPPMSLAFSPDGTLLAAASSQATITLIDTARGIPRPPYSVGGGGFAYATFSPDGRRLVAWGPLNGALVFDLTKDPPTQRHVRGSAGAFVAAAFSPDGSVFATADNLGNVQFRDGRTFAPRGAPVASSEAFVAHIAFSPDGALIAASDVGATPQTSVPTSLSTRLIDARTHQPIGDAISGVYITVSFSPDGTTMATPYPAAPAAPAAMPLPSRHTTLWELDPTTWRKRACEIAGHNLTASETRQYLPSDAGTRATCARFER